MSAASIAGSVVAYGAKNYVLNGCFRINQRGASGGLSTGSYMWDRWYFTNGTNITVSGRTVTLNGIMLQHIENPDLTGKTVTVSVEDPTDTVNIAVGTYDSVTFNSGNITAGAGRRSVTLVVPPTATTHVQLKITTSGAVSFKNIQLEKGSIATDFEWRFVGTELALCQRFFCNGQGYHFFPSPGSTFADTYRVTYPVHMRAVPTWSYNIFSSSTLYSSSVALVRADFTEIKDIANGNTNILNQFTWSATAEL